MSVAAAPTQFFGKTYDETLALLVATRDYLAHARPAEAPGLAPMDRARVHCEALRVTARLTQIMAWLLAQKAVFAGELSASEAGERFKLTAGLGAPSDDTEGGQEPMPRRLGELLDQSRRLYVRVVRLDELSRRSLN